jgi:putative Holliday junction resolvase
MRLLGIDGGTKRIGVALSDETGRFASPYSVVEAGQSAVREISQICEREGVEKIILGRSLNYDGQDNTVQSSTNRLAEELANVTGRPVEFELEVLTTKEALRDIGKDNLTDARAAALILKSYIDRNTHD